MKGIKITQTATTKIDTWRERTHSNRIRFVPYLLIILEVYAQTIVSL